jgi:hypothetical protein
MTSGNRVWTLALITAALVVLPLRAADRKDIDKAIENGIAHLKSLQEADGTWRYREIGATALAGLTLLECDVPVEDPAIQKAATAVREASVTLDTTYSLSLCILFLDRLGDTDDIPLIESMTVRLLAGQNAAGGWTYKCPNIGKSEVVRLTTVVKDKADKPPDKRDASKKDGERRQRGPSDEIKSQLDALNRGRVARLAPSFAGGGGGVGDNSNTQFAILGLWVSRRHGMPVERALYRIDRRFRASQNSDGGWGYTPHPEGSSEANAPDSSVAMTCAGLLGIAAGHAASTTVLKARDPNKDKENTDDADHKKETAGRDLNKDPRVLAGLIAIGKWIGTRAENGERATVPAMFSPPDKLYYTFWSVERVAVAYSLDTIGNRDWYAWGADVIVERQLRDGSWGAGYREGGVDTSFALLFLRRANLANDLSTTLKGKVRDPGRVTLKAGGGDSKPELPEVPKEKPPPRETAPVDSKPAEPSKEKPSVPKPTPPAAGEGDAARLAQELIQANPAKQERLLDTLRENKGAEYTQALVKAIPKLDGDIKKKAREALAERLSRMTTATLRDRLKDDDAELRRAAALAAAMKEETAHIPRLIELLDDSDTTVARAAHAALKSLSGKDFGPAKDASRAENAQAVAAWKAWWKEKDGK